MSDMSGKPWFVRVRTATRFKLNPSSWQGWLVTLVYIMVVLALWLHLGTLRPRGLHVFAMLGTLAAMFGATAVLVAIALRTSHPTSFHTRKDSAMQDVKTQSTTQSDDWFVPHEFGLGATPVRWQGWALTIGFCVLMMLDVRFVHEQIAQTGIALALLVLFTVIVIRKTRGGFGWRWGVDK